MVERYHWILSLASVVPLFFAAREAPLPVALAINSNSSLFLSRLSAQPSYAGRVLQAAQSLESGSHNIVWVRRAYRLGHYIPDADGLHNGANRTTRYNAGSFRRGLEQHAPGPKDTSDLMRNG